jgi:hypothetical protein
MFDQQLARFLDSLPPALPLPLADAARTDAVAALPEAVA